MNWENIQTNIICAVLLYYVLTEHFKHARIIGDCVNRNTAALEKLSVKIDGCQK